MCPTRADGQFFVTPIEDCPRAAVAGQRNVLALPGRWIDEDQVSRCASGEVRQDHLLASVHRVDEGTDAEDLEIAAGLAE